MPIIGYIIIFSLFGSIGSLIGGALLLWKQEITRKISHWLISFAAGALLGVAFLDLLPESLESLNSFLVGSIILGAILFFFLLEKLFLWYHCHDQHCDVHEVKGGKYLIILGDAVHNFVDGIIITVSFLVSIPLGISTALAVILHEIPQEISDFSILTHHGVSRMKNLVVNIFAALATPVGALLTYAFADLVAGVAPILLAFAAGVFIYIANSDLIPELHHEVRFSHSALQILIIILGILAIWFTA